MTAPDSFNLGNDKWIPVSKADTGANKLVSVREALLCAHELGGWPSGEALFPTAAIRLLAAFVYAIHDADGIADEDSFDDLADRLWEAGRFDAGLGVGTYCMDRALEHGLVVRSLGDTLALCPPLVISEAQVDELFTKLTRAVDETLEYVNREG